MTASKFACHSHWTDADPTFLFPSRLEATLRHSSHVTIGFDVRIVDEGLELDELIVLAVQVPGIGHEGNHTDGPQQGDEQ